MSKDPLPFGFGVLDRIDQHLSGMTDPVLLILKGHLLIEETLYVAVQSTSRNPEYLDYAGLRSVQLIYIARSLFDLRPKAQGPDEGDRIWDALIALNTIRNRLAHRLAPDDLTPLLKRLFFLDSDPPTSLQHLDAIPALKRHLNFLLGVLATLHYDLAEKRDLA